MDGIEESDGAKSLVAQTAAVLLTHGKNVEVPAIGRVVSHLAARLAEGMNMDPAEAVLLLTPEAVADVIIKAADGDDRAAAVRPVRVQDVAIAVPPWVSGRLLMVLGQVARWAGANEAARDQHHALGLVTELGGALVESRKTETMEIHVGILDEVIDLAERAAGHIEANEWAPCSCGQDHSAVDAPIAVVTAMRSDADLARRLRAKADGG